MRSFDTDCQFPCIRPQVERNSSLQRKVKICGLSSCLCHPLLVRDPEYLLGLFLEDRQFLGGLRLSGQNPRQTGQRLVNSTSDREITSKEGLQWRIQMKKLREYLPATKIKIKQKPQRNSGRVCSESPEAAAWAHCSALSAWSLGKDTGEQDSSSGERQLRGMGRGDR